MFSLNIILDRFIYHWSVINFKVTVTVAFLMLNAIVPLTCTLAKMNIHPAMKSVRRMVRCERIVSLVIPWVSGTKVVQRVLIMT